MGTLLNLRFRYGQACLHASGIIQAHWTFSYLPVFRGGRLLIIFLYARFLLVESR